MGRGVSTDFPGWQREFYSVPDHEDAGRLPADVKPMNVGPLMQDAMCLVAAKLAFALHYHHTGKIVPRTGFVAVRYETNVTMQSRELPADLVAMLGPSQMLTQGEWTSEGHFAYRGAWVPDGTGSVSIAHVGEAFFYLMFVVAQNAGSDEPQLEMNEFNEMRHFRPGDMQKADAVTSGRYNTPLPVYKTSGTASGTLG
jgi:hypothetical protein